MKEEKKRKKRVKEDREGRWEKEKINQMSK